MSEKDAQIKSADEILQTPDLKEMTLYVEPWDTHIRIKALSKARHQAIRKEAMKDGKFDADRWEMGILRQGIVEPQFTDAQFEQLHEKSTGALELIGQAIVQLSGLTPDHLEKIKKLFS